MEPKTITSEGNRERATGNSFLFPLLLVTRSRQLLRGMFWVGYKSPSKTFCSLFPIPCSLLNVTCTKHGKPYGLSNIGGWVWVGWPQRKRNCPEGKGCWRKQKPWVMQGIGVNIPYIERWQTANWSSTINQSKAISPGWKIGSGMTSAQRNRFFPWASINWKSVKKRVRNLRQRIYRATENGQWNKVRSLMKLMLR